MRHFVKKAQIEKCYTENLSAKNLLCGLGWGGGVKTGVGGGGWRLEGGER